MHFYEIRKGFYLEVQTCRQLDSHGQYVELLDDFPITELNDLYAEYMWFQQDRATDYTGEC